MLLVIAYYTYLRKIFFKYFSTTGKKNFADVSDNLKNGNFFEESLFFFSIYLFEKQNLVDFDPKRPGYLYRLRYPFLTF